MSIDRFMGRSVLHLLLCLCALALAGCQNEAREVDKTAGISQNLGLPAGFVDETVVKDLGAATAMAFTPDGRIFVCNQDGRLFVVKNGALLSSPFVTVPTAMNGERGLLGVAIDPNFTSNRFVYVYYTLDGSPAARNRITRFTANGDVAVAGSETVLMTLDDLSGASNHNGGAMHFGPDGKLYIAVGDNANRANAQLFTNRLGKLLRINSNGSIPSDNPFFASATGDNRAIWALGLRNPFTFSFQPGSGRVFINDVGENTWEEINEGVAGGNYGWPTVEGVTTDPRYRSPLLAYGHAAGGADTGCAITGGTFYNPSIAQFPSSYVGKYFYADYCSNWIRVFDPATGSSQAFGTGAFSPVDLAVGPDGLLYYLNRGGVSRVRATTSQAPAINAQPANVTVSVGQVATFSVAASGSAPLAYQWQRAGVNIAGATGSSYSRTTVAGDNGATFRVVVSNSVGSVTSNAATLTVTTNAPPTATITSPANGTTYAAGDTIFYAGTGTDPESGTLPASAFTWEVLFHHDTHTHPFVPATSGASSGSFVVPRQGELATNVFYRIHLTVRDSAGLTSTVTRDVTPRVTTVTLASNPSGLQLTLDGTPVTTPFSFASVVGVTRTLGAVTPQTIAGTTYAFGTWSDGGGASHSINAPSANTTYTANFVPSGSGGLKAEYFDNSDFTNLKLTRTDPTVNLDVGTGSPATGIEADTFSVRWTGTITPQFAQAYSLFTNSDDGIRVWFNGALLIDNFTLHAPTENSGVTPVLVAGQAYPIRIEFFENTGGALATLSWSSASQAKQLVPQSRLSPETALPSAFPIRINFQLAGAPIPAGYIADTGLTFSAQSGSTFGWNTDHSALARDRNTVSDQRLDTLVHFHAGGVWEFAVPNGTYNVLVSVGDAQWASVHTLNVEGVSYWNAKSLGIAQFVSATNAVTVADGRLTIDQGAGAEMATRINYLEISKP